MFPTWLDVFTGSDPMTPDERRRRDEILAEWFRSRDRAARRARVAEVGCVLFTAASVAFLVAVVLMRW